MTHDPDGHMDHEAGGVPHADRHRRDGASHPRSGHAHADHDKHAGHSVAMFRDRFWLSLFLTLPTLAWSSSVQDWLGFAARALACPEERRPQRPPGRFRVSVMSSSVPCSPSGPMDPTVYDLRPDWRYQALPQGSVSGPE